MGCGSTKVQPLQPASAKRERSKSIVTIESQQRTVAAYRRQRMARSLEQDLYLRAEAEVEKALMLKRSSVDERRPSYVLRALKDLQEIEEGQEETEDTSHPKIMVDSCSELDLKNNHTHEHLTTSYDYHSNNSEHCPVNKEDATTYEIDKTNETNENSFQVEDYNQKRYRTDDPELHTDKPEYLTDKPEYHTDLRKDRSNIGKAFADHENIESINRYNDNHDHFSENDNYIREPEYHTERPDSDTSTKELFANNKVASSRQDNTRLTENTIMKGHEREEVMMNKAISINENIKNESSIEKLDDVELSHETNSEAEIKEMGEKKMRNENCINENLEQGSLKRLDVDNTKINTENAILEENMELPVQQDDGR